MTPADPTIDDSPACKNALDALTRVRMLSHGALEADALDEDVREDEALAQRLGIQGVPFFVFDRRYGLSGAQPVETMLTALERAWEEAVNLQA